MIIVFKEWYMSGNWRGGDVEDNNHVLETDQTMRNLDITREDALETDGELSSMERESDYIFY